MLVQETVIMCGGQCFYANMVVTEGDLPEPVKTTKNWQAEKAGWKCVKHPWLDPSAHPLQYMNGKRIWSCKPIWLCPECYEWHQGRLGDWYSENEVI